MPDLSGIQLAEAIGRVNPDLPIILCSGLGDTVERDHPCIQGYLSKPVELTALSARIRSVLDPSPAEP